MDYLDVIDASRGIAPQLASSKRANPDPVESRTAPERTIVEETDVSRPELEPPRPPIRLVAYQPEIPGNLGAIIRLGACFGAPVHVVEPCGFPFSVKALRRTAMDYARRAEVTRHDDWEAFEQARRANAAGGRLIALSTRATTSVWAFEFGPGDHLVLGRESAGLGEEAWESVDHALRIPICDGERSLNVAAAAAIALGEATRQLCARAPKIEPPAPGASTKSAT